MIIGIASTQSIFFHSIVAQRPASVATATMTHPHTAEDRANLLFGTIAGILIAVVSGPILSLILQICGLLIGVTIFGVYFFGEYEDGLLAISFRIIIIVVRDLLYSLFITGVVSGYLIGTYAPVINPF